MYHHILTEIHIFRDKSYKSWQ